MSEGVRGRGLVHRLVDVLRPPAGERPARRGGAARAGLKQMDREPRDKARRAAADAGRAPPRRKAPYGKIEIGQGRGLRPAPAATLPASSSVSSRAA